MGGLQERLEHVGDGAGEAGLYFAADDSGDEAGEGGVEIAGGEVVAGEEVGQVFAEFFGGLGLGFFLGVVEAEVRVAADAGGAAAAAIFVSEKRQRDTRSFALREDIGVSLIYFWIFGFAVTGEEIC